MGRLTNMFSPSKMTNLVKNLNFKEGREEEVNKVDEKFLREFREYQAQEETPCEQKVDQILPGDPMKKVELMERSIKKEMWMHAREEFVKEERKRLRRGEAIEKWCDKGMAKVSEIQEDKGPHKSLFDLLQMERGTDFVIGDMGVKGEGKGDNCEGSSYTKTSSFSLLSSKYFACCSPFGSNVKHDNSFRSDQAYVNSESNNSSRTFSFISPLEDMPEPQENVSWWPRPVWPSSKQSVFCGGSWRWVSTHMLERSGEY